MDSSMIWNGQKSFLIAKETQELPKNFNFLKFSNDLKNVSRHCGGHYNIKIKHFEHFLVGEDPGAPP